ncbi:hypothetical protein C4580_02865 [Candidatus Woesearchaeota archaeon]|nr:MAG: hypothetical protein C4580_02865 [Candidatus Woesearchaeota archaeon]
MKWGTLLLLFCIACTQTPQLIAQPEPVSQPAHPPAQDAQKTPLLPALQAPPLPQKTGLDSKAFTWKFKKETYSVTLPLYTSINQHYQNQPRVITYRGALPSNWQEQIYVTVLSLNETEGFNELITYLNKTKQEKKFSNDDFADFVITFVQTLPYDYAGLENPNRQVRYPYQTLFDQTGVCSDKTLLAAKILARFGYGVALFLFDDENHMSLGLQCPKIDSSYLSGYCYVETTAAEATGVAPQLLSGNISLASQPLVIPITNGTAYTRAADNLRKEVARRGFCADLPDATENLTISETRMKELETRAAASRDPKDYAEYRDAYTAYRRTYEDYKVVHAGCKGIEYAPSGFY